MDSPARIAVFYRGIGVIRGELGLAVSDRAHFPAFGLQALTSGLLAEP